MSTEATRHLCRNAIWMWYVYLVRSMCNTLAVFQSQITFNECHSDGVYVRAFEFISRYFHTANRIDRTYVTLYSIPRRGQHGPWRKCYNIANQWHDYGVASYHMICNVCIYIYIWRYDMICMCVCADLSVGMRVHGVLCTLHVHRAFHFSSDDIWYAISFKSDNILCG